MEIHIDEKEKFVLAKIKKVEGSETVKVSAEITHADEKQHENKLNWKKIDIYLDKEELIRIKDE